MSQCVKQRKIRNADSLLPDIQARKESERKARKMAEPESQALLKKLRR